MCIEKRRGDTRWNPQLELRRLARVVSSGLQLYCLVSHSESVLLCDCPELGRTQDNCLGRQLHSAPSGAEGRLHLVLAKARRRDRC